MAVGGAVLWSWCFGREPSGWWPWFALTPLILLLERRHAVLWGFVYGVTLWMGSMYWIAGTLETFGGLPQGLAWLAQTLMVMYLGFDPVVFVIFGRRIWRRGGALPVVALPALWVSLEWLRGIVVGRFPWNLAAYAWVDMPGALPLAAWVGSFGVSFLLVLVNVCLAESWRRRRFEPALVGVLTALTLLALAGRFSHGEEPARSTAGHEARVGHEVRVIQPNSTIVHTWEESWEYYRRLIAMSEAECAETARPGERRLLVWPESAAWPHSYGTSERLRRDIGKLNDLGCDVLLGSQINQGQAAYNASLMVTGRQQVGSYAKRKLVPWGEYVPLAKVLPFMGKVARNAGNFTPGTDIGLLPWGEEQIAMAICYEVIFPAAVAQQVRSGASILATVTNDAWYGDTTAPHQHFRAARFRAAENRRPLIRAALTGISGLIDRRGQVTSSLGVGEQGVLRARIAGSRDLSPFSRAPWAVPTACALLAALAIATSWRRVDYKRSNGLGKLAGRWTDEEHDKLEAAIDMTGEIDEELWR